jgi:hypothetical protein
MKSANYEILRKIKHAKVEEDCQEHIVKYSGPSSTERKKEQLTVPSIEWNSGFGGILLQLIISTCSKCVCTY